MDRTHFRAAVMAVIDGDIETLRSMLAARPELATARSKNRNRATLLHYVAANGVEDALQRTPANAVDVARLLLEAGAPPDALARGYRGGPNETPLCLLVSSWHPYERGVQVALVDALIDGGARVDGLRDDGAPLTVALSFGYTRAAEALVRRGARLDSLPLAAGVGDLAATRAFLASDFPTARGRYAPALRVDPPGTSAELVQEAFHLAVTHGRVEVAACLLEAGADPNGLVRGHHAELALMQALFVGRTEMARFLVERGADSLAYDYQRRATPRAYAEANHPEILPCFRQASKRGSGPSKGPFFAMPHDQATFARLRRTLRSIAPARVARLLDDARASGWYHLGPRRLDAAIAAIDAEVGHVGDRAYGLAALLAHGNGFYREAALTMIEPPRDAALVAALMFAADDHVPQVQQRAERLLALCRPVHLVPCAAVLTADVLDYRPQWRTDVIVRLDEADSIAALRVLARTHQGADAVAALTILVDHLHHAEHLASLLDAREWRVRRAIAHRAAASGHGGLLLDLVRDGHSWVRYAAVWNAMALEPTARAAVMRIAIDDRSRRVRRRAAPFLRDDDEIVARIRSGVASPSPRDRAHALETLAFLAPPLAPSLARAALDDASARVRRAAYQALVDADALRPEDVARLASETDGRTLVCGIRLALAAQKIPRPAILPLLRAPVLRATPGAAALLRHLHTFDQLPMLIRAAGEAWRDVDRAVDSFVESYEAVRVKGWLQPTDAQRALIHEAVEAHGAALPARLRSIADRLTRD